MRAALQDRSVFRIFGKAGVQARRESTLSRCPTRYQAFWSEHRFTSIEPFDSGRPGGHPAEADRDYIAGRARERETPAMPMAAREHAVRDPRFRAIIDTTAVPEVLASGFRFTEGPVWHPRWRRLVFSDIAGNALHVTSLSGPPSVFRAPSHMANGNTLDRSGRLVTCEHATSRLVRAEHDHRVVVLASHWKGRALNSPNDVIVARGGQIYFTDPTYGRMPFHGVERAPELDFRGVFRLDPGTGRLDLVADDLDQPNGLCLSADETRLFVSDSERGHIRVFDLDSDGGVRGGAVWAEITGEEPGTPDGLKVDAAGNFYSCGPGGIHVFAPDSECLGVIRTPQEAANFTWAGSDLRTLVVTAGTTLYRLPVKVPGVPLVETD